MKTLKNKYKSVCIELSKHLEDGLVEFMVSAIECLDEALIVLGPVDEIITCLTEWHKHNIEQVKLINADVTNMLKSFKFLEANLKNDFKVSENILKFSTTDPIKIFNNISKPFKLM